MAAKIASTKKRKRKRKRKPDKGDIRFRDELDAADVENAMNVASFVTGVSEVTSVVGVRYVLSPNLRRVNIEYLLAKANLYGLGPGVFPLHRHPYPPIRRCLSYINAVFEDEVSEADRAGKETIWQWLAKQPYEVQLGVLGKRQKVVAFKRRKLRATELMTPWRDIARRLGYRTDEQRPPRADPVAASRRSAPISDEFMRLVGLAKNPQPNRRRIYQAQMPGW